METVPINVPEAVQGHKAESDRLGRLTEFLTAFAPAIGESRQPGQDADAPNRGVRVSRDKAIIAAFKAVERLAVESFRFPKKGKK
jgi:hypothetical protein